MTAEIMPWKRPCSRTGTMVLMIASAPTMRPPPPSPCRARKQISCHMLCAIPDSAEPTRKIVIADRKTPLRPYMSPILPQTGVETAVVSV